MTPSKPAIRVGVLRTVSWRSPLQLRQDRDSNQGSPDSEATYLLPQHGRLRWCRTSLDTSSARRCPDELGLLGLLGVVHGLKEADASGSPQTSV